MSAYRNRWRRLPLLAGTLALFALVAIGTLDGQQPAPVAKLRIGSSGSLTGTKRGQKETAALDTLQMFIKEETGLANEILPQENWQQLADKLVKGELQLGVFQGYEFAWAQGQHAQFKPLALAVNVYRYPVGYLIVNKGDAAKDIAGLKGQALSIPTTAPRFLGLFVKQQCASVGKTPENLFGKITTPDSIEDAIDDVVDNPQQVTAVDRAALEAFKRSKPGRFKKLRPLAHSQPFPPPVVAYYGNVLDQATRARFQSGLLGASKKEKGETMLTLFHLTGFDAPPSDFDKVLNATRQHYPAPAK